LHIIFKTLKRYLNEKNRFFENFTVMLPLTDYLLINAGKRKKYRIMYPNLSDKLINFQNHRNANLRKKRLKDCHT